MNFKYILICLITVSFFAKSNTILAVVDDEIISSLDLSLYDIKNPTKEKKLALINLLIDDKIENKQIERLGIQPTNDSIIKELTAIAVKNNTTIEELQKSNKFNSIVKQVKNNLKKIILRQIITQNLIKINKYPNVDKKNIYKFWLQDIKQTTFIDIYEDKL